MNRDEVNPPRPASIAALDDIRAWFVHAKRASGETWIASGRHDYTKAEASALCDSCNRIHGNSGEIVFALGFKDGAA